MRSLLYPLLLLCAVLILPLPALAVSALSISSPGADGVFILRGAGLEDVTGLDISVSYDQATLSEPQVVLGSIVSGMFNAVNPSNPIRMGIVHATKTISGSGTIATITFKRTGASPGKITALSAVLINSHKEKVAMAAPVISNPVEAPASEPGDSSGGASGGGGGSSAENGGSSGGSSPTPSNGSPVVLGGTVTIPSDLMSADRSTSAGQEPRQEDPERRETEPTPVADRGAAQGAAPAAEVAKEAEHAQEAPPQPAQSVLERFRLFQGEKTVQNLVALFARDKGEGFSQSPAVAIADGKATVRVSISRVAGEKTPNFAFDSARFVSLYKTGEREWEVEVRPDRGALRSSVTVFTNGRALELPLAVAPEAVVAGKSGKPSQADFVVFLRERGTPSAPKFDLNGDGRRDYLDDYIFTANYLAKTEEKSNGDETKRQKQ